MLAFGLSLQKPNFCCLFTTWHVFAVEVPIDNGAHGTTVVSDSNWSGSFISPGDWCLRAQSPWCAVPRCSASLSAIRHHRPWTEDGRLSCIPGKFLFFLCSPPLGGCIVHYIQPSACLSICPVTTINSKNEHPSMFKLSGEVTNMKNNWQSSQKVTDQSQWGQKCKNHFWHISLRKIHRFMW